MHLVIVESPTKAKTIRKFLGPEYKVLASMGHVRDLPESSSEIPAAYKKTPWGQLGVNVEQDFEPLYVIPKRKSKTVSELKAALKEADVLYLATDEDREGESISWHLLQLLKPKVPVHRMVFHEITKQAIQSALEHPRELDERLVRAQETRRILDRLVGYTISPILWKKIAYGLSAGRVQSSALKAIVDRERARIAFKTSSYWDVVADIEAKDGACEAKLISVGGKRIASGKDFDETTGALKAGSEAVFIDEARARTVTAEVKAADWKVVEVTEKPVTRRPPPPFITSTLQQEANRKLGLSSKETMRIAQTLYEHGYITYMRTDSVALSTEAVEAARRMVGERFGSEFVPSEPRHYGSVRGAQEAHEAIRPSLALIPPHEIDLSGAERKLYELIWMRTLASQMTDSQQLQMSVLFDAASYTFQATGLTIVAPGFLRAYVEGEEDIEGALGDKERILPKLSQGESVTCREATAQGHETKPPARFTEASLIQWMEKEGIGRPSTYASIIGTLVDRAYVQKQSSALVPTFTGFVVTQFMEQHFSDLVNATFTSGMEKQLDEIADGQLEWLPYLRGFYLGDQGLGARVQTESKNKEEGTDHRRVALPQVPEAIIRVGKFGAYVEAPHPQHHTTVKATFPEDMTPGELTQTNLNELLSKAQQGPTTLGEDPETGEQIYLRTGSYGPYLQLGEDPIEEEGKKKTKAKKPKRVSIPKTVPLNELDRAKALALLALPRLLGVHPTSGKEIRAGLGRFGPYIVHDGEFRSLKAEDDLFTVTLERALELLAMPKGTRGGGVSKPIGPHPKDKKPITLHSGKFGWYVKHGRTNATLPKDTKPEDVTVELAVALLAARKEKGK